MALPTAESQWSYKQPKSLKRALFFGLGFRQWFAFSGCVLLGVSVVDIVEILDIRRVRLRPIVAL